MKFACIKCGEVLEEYSSEPCQDCQILDRLISTNLEMKGYREHPQGGYTDFWNLKHLVETLRKQILKEVRDEIQAHSQDPWLHPSHKIR